MSSGGDFMRDDVSLDVSNAMFEDYPDVVDVQQMSQMLGISTKTAYKLLRANNIQHLKIGRIYKIPKISVLRFIGVA
jgi:excisionase family DNA binding protein